MRTWLSNVTIAGVTYNGAVDLDDVFHPRGTVAAANNVDMRADNGSDLSARYYPRALGGSTLPVDTGFRNWQGTDLRQIYAQRGTVGGGGDGGGGGCLPFGTIIPLCNGGTKRIEDVQPGDQVVGYYVDGMVDESEPDWTAWTVEREEGKSGRLLPVTVRMTLHASYQSHWLINGHLRATYEHRFFVLRDNLWAWRQARDLRAGDAFLSIDREEVSIESVAFVNSSLQVANIDVEDVDCFMFEAFPGTIVLSHNPDQKN
ncbi:Hint domain-containing protein [Lysobacter enzymogenes]|uniref:Hint domain-containing protein n=1 Tax=Lysobacter enzymogenes TaxID=69 RepID=UPI00384CC7C2